MDVKLSKLELALLLIHANKSNSCAVKARKNERDASFLLLLYSYPRLPKRLAIRLPMKFWDNCKTDESRLGIHPNNGFYSPENPYSYIGEDSIQEIGKEELLEYFNKRLTT